MTNQTNRARTRELLDQYFSKAKSEPRLSLPDGWIRTIRRSLNMTESELAKRIGITQTSLHRLEKNEIEGKVQIESLRKAAEALNCDLYISLVPRKPLNETLLERALELATAELTPVHQSMKLEDQALRDSSDLDKRLAEELIRQNRVHW